MQCNVSLNMDSDTACCRLVKFHVGQNGPKLVLVHMTSTMDGAYVHTCSREPNSLATDSESACICSTSACAARLPARLLLPVPFASSCS
jgi:hypothetical protein